MATLTLKQERPCLIKSKGVVLGYWLGYQPDQTVDNLRDTIQPHNVQPILVFYKFKLFKSS